MKATIDFLIKVINLKSNFSMICIRDIRAMSPIILLQFGLYPIEREILRIYNKPIPPLIFYLLY